MERYLTTSLKDIGSVDTDGPIETAQKFADFYHRIGQTKIAVRFLDAVEILKGE